MILFFDLTHVSVGFVLFHLKENTLEFNYSELSLEKFVLINKNNAWKFFCINLLFWDYFSKYIFLNFWY